MSVSLITIDGVLRKLMGASPIEPGMRLYRGLSASGRIILSHDDDDVEAVSEWLELHGCFRHDFIDTPQGTDPITRANMLRSQGYHLDLVVTPDPAVAQGMIHAGLNTLLFTHSQYAHPAWRPDTAKGVQEWATIMEATARAARLKAADERLKPVE